MNDDNFEKLVEESLKTLSQKLDKVTIKLDKVTADLQEVKDIQEHQVLPVSNYYRDYNKRLR